MISELCARTFWCIFGRFWKCFVRRKGYKEGVFGLIIAIFAGYILFVLFKGDGIVPERRLTI